MEENIKNKVIILLVLLTGIFLVMSFGSCNNSRKQKLSRDKEMAMRLDLEEKLSKLSQGKNNLEQDFKNISKNLEEEKIAQDIIKKALSQEQLANQNLKEELEKVTKLKETLEAGLKEALAANKTIVDLPEVTPGL